MRMAASKDACASDAEKLDDSYLKYSTFAEDQASSSQVWSFFCPALPFRFYTFVRLPHVTIILWNRNVSFSVSNPRYSFSFFTIIFCRDFFLFLQRRSGTHELPDSKRQGFSNVSNWSSYRVRSAAIISSNSSHSSTLDILFLLEAVYHLMVFLIARCVIFTFNYRMTKINHLQRIPVSRWKAKMYMM